MDAPWAWHFQIVDDVLDLTATEEVLGKPVASDLREGKATLAGDPLLRPRHGDATGRRFSGFWMTAALSM